MACHLRIGPIANLVRRALLALGDTSACLFFAYNPLQIQFAYALKQCDSRRFDMIRVSQWSRCRNPQQQALEFMLPIHERIPHSTTNQTQRSTPPGVAKGPRPVGDYPHVRKTNKSR